MADADETGLVFAESDFYLDIDKVNMGPEIGGGNFSKVYMGSYFGDLVAVKKQTRTERDVEAYLLRELAVLKNLNSPHLVEYMGACDVVSDDPATPSCVFIVTELLRGGDLSAFLIQDAEVGWKLRARIACDAASGLQALHDNHVVHRDVKSANILLDDAWRGKLCDFGFARSAATQNRMTICGTDDYMAPEMLFDEPYGPAADIFSFGLVLAEIITRQPIGTDGFGVRTPAQRFQLDIDAMRAAAPADAPPSLVELMAQCLSYEADERPETEVVVDWLAALVEDLPEDSAPLPPLPELPEWAENPLRAPAPAPAPEPAPEPARPEPEPVPATATASERPRANTGTRRPALSAGTLTATGALGSQIVFKTGFLFKRNRSGFRNWKKRWFVLCGNELSWYQSQAANECHGTLDLRGCTVVGGKNHRFQLLRTGAVGISGPADDRLFNRELGAESAAAFNEWVEALRAAIALGACHSCGASVGRGGSVVALGGGSGGAERVAACSEACAAALTASAGAGAGAGGAQADGAGAHDFSTLAAWLEALGLSALLPDMRARGYGDIGHVQLGGLEDADFEYLGIDDLAARAKLRTAPCAPRALAAAALAAEDEVVVAIKRATAYGRVVRYEVEARLGARVETTLKRYSDFDHLNSRLQVRGVPLPALPRKGIRLIQNQLNPEFIENRREQLESYLRAVAVSREFRGRRRLPGVAGKLWCRSGHVKHTHPTSPPTPTTPHTGTQPPNVDANIPSISSAVAAGRKCRPGCTASTAPAMAASSPSTSVAALTTSVRQRGLNRRRSGHSGRLACSANTSRSASSKLKATTAASGRASTLSPSAASPDAKRPALSTASAASRRSPTAPSPLSATHVAARLPPARVPSSDGLPKSPPGHCA